MRPRARLPMTAPYVCRKRPHRTGLSGYAAPVDVTVLGPLPHLVIAPGHGRPGLVVPQGVDAPLRALATRIFRAPRLAGEYAQLLVSVDNLPIWPTPAWLEWDLWAATHLVGIALLGEPEFGTDKQPRIAATLGLALEAERHWVQAHGRKNRWTAIHSLSVHDGQHRTGSFYEAKADYGPLTDPDPFRGRQATFESTCTPIPARSALWPGPADEAAYWRRAADVLWRLLSLPEHLFAEPVEVVVLDTSPCGIRRLTAVRVPRAPGCACTPSIPHVSVLAAA